MSRDLIHRRWRAVPQADLHWKYIEDQYVVYNAGSGQTHIIDPVSLLLVQHIAKHPCGTDELLQEMGTLLGIDGTPESYEKILGRLEQLESLGLIETVTS